MARPEAGRLELSRFVRGSHKRAVEQVLALAPEPARLEDAGGKLLAGASDGADRAPIVAGGAEVGAVIGGRGVLEVAKVVQHLYERETEKLALAAETLGRYKELTVLYDMSSSLSKVLDVDEAARRIVGEAHRFLKASQAALLLVDRRGERLEPLASVGADGMTFSAQGEGLEARALRSAQAELIDRVEGGGSVMVAPLRSGEAAFGLLRVASREAELWTAGDLKLVTSLAAHAASAISHAMLHRDQLRQQAMRNQIERFVSPTLLEAALEGTEPSLRDAPFAALFCDVAQLARSMDAAASTEDVLEAMLEAASAAIDTLLEHGGTVSTSQGEMIVALFGSTEARSGAARAALAGTALARRLGRASGGIVDGAPGIGIAHLGCGQGQELSAFLEGVGTAASLQAEAAGRILVDSSIAASLSPDGLGLHVVPAETISAPRGPVEAYEVRP